MNVEELTTRKIKITKYIVETSEENSVGISRKREQSSRNDNDEFEIFKSRKRRTIQQYYMHLESKKDVLRSCRRLPHLMTEQNGNFYDEKVPLMSDQTFIQKFRMSRKSFEILVEELTPFLKKKDTLMDKAIPVAKRIMISIYILKSNASIDLVSDVYGVGRSTVPYILHEFCRAVNDNLFKKYVKFPASTEAKREVAEGFLRKWQFPGCFGSIDGTHFPIMKPGVYPEDYRNYKGFYSIILLAMVSYNYLFQYVHVGTPGRANDASVFNKSALAIELERDPPPDDLHMIGDGAFPMKMWLMKPYTPRINMPAHEKNFNERLSRARVVVEDAFGRLKGRWHIIMKRADYSLSNLQEIAKTCIVLHNFCEIQKEPYYKSWHAPVIENLRQFPQPHQTMRERPMTLEDATNKRNTLTIQLMTP